MTQLRNPEILWKYVADAGKWTESATVDTDVTAADRAPRIRTNYASSDWDNGNWHS
jgi:hypothetical protein